MDMKRKYEKSTKRVLALAAVLSMALSAPVWAEGKGAHREDLQNQWINMGEGPGVAQWVDENGVVSEETGVRKEDADEHQGPGSAKEDSKPLPGTSGQGDAKSSGISVKKEEESSQVQAEKETQPASERVIDPARPMVALTFDDGPYAPVGNRIMDCLANYGGKVTFYVVGNRCASYRDEMQRMAAEGHEIGNHTYEHKYLNKLNAQQIQYQVNKGSEAIQAASGVAPATVRLPGGNKNATVLSNVNAPMIMWSIDTLDWKTKDAQNTINTVLNNIKDGDIVLMHELYTQTGDAAVQIIPALIERGYQLVTVSELARYRGGLEKGKLYSAFRP